MKSLYANYLKERENKEIFQEQNGRGFLIYKVLEDCIYIVDIYVTPEFRKSHVAKEMADQIAELALSLNKPALLGSVSPLDPNVSENMKVLLAYGMKFHKTTPDLIYFVKELVSKGGE